MIIYFGHTAIVMQTDPPHSHNQEETQRALAGGVWVVQEHFWLTGKKVSQGNTVHTSFQFLIFDMLLDMQIWHF